jgi:hypothetical protein
VECARAVEEVSNPVSLEVKEDFGNSANVRTYILYKVEIWTGDQTNSLIVICPAHDSGQQ